MPPRTSGRGRHAASRSDSIVRRGRGRPGRQRGLRPGQAHPRQRPPYELRPLSVLACPDRTGMAQDRAVQPGHLPARRARQPAADPPSLGMARRPALADRGLSRDAVGPVGQCAQLAALPGRPAGPPQARDLGIRREGLDRAAAAPAEEAGRRLTGSTRFPGPLSTTPARAGAGAGSRGRGDPRREPCRARSNGRRSGGTCRAGRAAACAGR